MESFSLWEAITPKRHSYPALISNAEADVAIIGGGITGMTAALELIKRGKTVIVLEAHQVGLNTTGHSTGNLYTLVQPYYQKIKKLHGEEVALEIIKARQAAIDYIESNVNEYNIKCNFLRRPSYLYTNQKNKINFLENETDLLHKGGLDTKYLTALDLPIATLKATVIANQGKMNPLAYVVELAKVAQQAGVLIYENSPVIGIKEGKVNELQVAEHVIRARHVIFATHIPKGIDVTSLLAPAFRSYVIAFKTADNKPLNSGHYWGLDDPHFVISTHASHQDAKQDDLLVIAGRHHKTGKDHNARQNYAELERIINKFWPDNNVVYRWSAQHYQAADAIPYIGATNATKNVYLASGFFADGLVYGTAAAQMIADSIFGKENSLEKTLRPHRLAQLSAIASITEEGLNTFLNYAKDFPGNADVSKLDDITVGEGKLIDIKGEKCGAYRDESGKLHVVSAVCTHMKCILQWNNAEITWDCPCHGSRFSTEGSVLEGPAYVPLKKINLLKE